MSKSEDPYLWEISDNEEENYSIKQSKNSPDIFISISQDNIPFRQSKKYSNIFIRRHIFQDPKWNKIFDYKHVENEEIIKYYRENEIFNALYGCKSFLQKILLSYDKSFNDFNIIAIHIKKKYIVAYPKYGQLYIIALKDQNKVFEFDFINNSTSFDIYEYIITYLENIQDDCDDEEEGNMNENEYIEEIDANKNDNNDPKPIQKWDGWKDCKSPEQYHGKFIYNKFLKTYFRPLIHLVYNISDLYFFTNEKNYLENIHRKINLSELLSKLKSYGHLQLIDDLNLLLHNVIEVNFSENIITCINIRENGILTMIVYDFIDNKKKYQYNISIESCYSRYINLIHLITQHPTSSALATCPCHMSL